MFPESSTLDTNTNRVQNGKRALGSDSEPLSESDYRERHDASNSVASLEPKVLPEADAPDDDVPIARPRYLDRVYPGGGKLQEILGLTHDKGRYNNLLASVRRISRYHTSNSGEHFDESSFAHTSNSPILNKIVADVTKAHPELKKFEDSWPARYMVQNHMKYHLGGPKHLKLRAKKSANRSGNTAISSKGTASVTTRSRRSSTSSLSDPPELEPKNSVVAKTTGRRPVRVTLLLPSRSSLIETTKNNKPTISHLRSPASAPRHRRPPKKIQRISLPLPDPIDVESEDEDRAHPVTGVLPPTMRSTLSYRSTGDIEYEKSL